MKNTIQKVLSKEYRNNKQVWLYSICIVFVIGLLCHGFVYSHTYFSHDSVNGFRNRIQLYSVIANGKYLSSFLTIPRGTTTNPYLIGFLALSYISITSVILVNLFQIKNIVLHALVSIVLVTYEALTLTNATYLFISDVNMLALLMAVLTVYFLRKDGWIRLLSIITVAITCGIYQSYLGVTFGLLCILTIFDFMDQKSLKEIQKKEWIGLLCILIGLGIYYLGYQLCLFVFHLKSATSSNSVMQISLLNIQVLPKLIVDAYKYYFGKMIHPATFLPQWIGIVSICLILFTLWNLYRAFQEHSLSTKIIVFLMLLLFPLFLNFTYVLTSGFIHEIMIYPFTVTFLFPIFLLSKKNSFQQEKNSMKNLFVIICILIMGLHNGIFSNQVYQKKKVEFLHTEEVMNQIMDQVESLEGYEDGKTPIVFIGNMNRSALFPKEKGQYANVVGLWSTSAITYYDTYQRFLNGLQGRDCIILTEEEAKSFAKNSNVKQMPAYPTDGSIQMVEDTVVVKIVE